MEPLTHFATGAALSRAGFNRKTGLATGTMVLAAEAPDIDVLMNIFGPVTGFAHHRGMTHTFLGVPFMAAVTLALVYLWYRWRRSRGWQPKLAPRWGLLYVFALIAGSSHILLDYTNNYGVRPFSPFLHEWYSWDIVFIVEPVLWAALGAALIFPRLFALVHEEIGARSSLFRGRNWAIFALLVMTGLWWYRDLQHGRAVQALGSRTYEGQDAVRVSAFPFPLNPFRWQGVVETESAFHMMEVNSSTGEIDPQGRARVRYKPEETEITLAAKRSRLGQVYLDWADYPLVEVEKLPREEGYLVRFQDLRFAYFRQPAEEEEIRTLGATVVLDPRLNVVEQRFGRRVQD